MKISVTNPITRLDYPDPDVIRVGDTYYMVSTTMHFMPGCEILRSYDLVNWEHEAYVYDRLDSTPGQILENGAHIYGKGMWAASLRYHKGVFYICFVANDTGRTYLFTSRTVEGPWEKHYMEGFYHDCSLLFDDDGRVYIAYGNREITITELKPDCSGPLEGGLHRLAVRDGGKCCLGFEGTHFYKINGRYYLFFIHSLEDRWMRAEACFAADSVDGEFTGGDVLVDDMGFFGQGVAQGGIVDTPEGKWYAVLFQDSGAVGRIPVLVPVSWDQRRPIFGEGGKAPRTFTVSSNKPKHHYEPLVQSDDFKGMEGLDAEEAGRRYGCFGLKSVWQFNHEPDLSLLSLDREEGVLWMTTGRVCRRLTQAGNILTQRMLYPGCSGEVTVKAGELKEGDYAGLCILQGCYGMAAVTRRQGKCCIVMRSAEPSGAGNSADSGGTEKNAEPSGAGNSAEPGSTVHDAGPGEKEWESVETAEDEIRLKAEADFSDRKDEVQFYYLCHGEWKKVGVTHKLRFGLDHFTGARFGLFLYASGEEGGRAGFRNFTYGTGTCGRQDNMEEV